MKKTCHAWFVASALGAAASGLAGELVLSEGGRCEYQIVLPDAVAHPILDQTLSAAAAIVREMFQTNGCTVPVVRESGAATEKPGLYLGDTAAARAAGIATADLPVWAYVSKVRGKDIVIAGRDWAAPPRQDRNQTPCSHGTVKGVTDFLRRYCGTRFLAPGGLAGIEFLPTPKIVVPDDLDLRREPLVNYNCGGRPTTDVGAIALNLLDNVTTEYFAHTHELAVPADDYADPHPEYFALISGKRIREYKHGWRGMVKEPHLCYSNPEVRERIYQDMLRSFDAGYPEYLSLQADGFKPCRCAECRKLFNTDDWGEKLWRLNKRWAERLLQDRPGRFLVVAAYTVTGKPPQSFTDFPPNLRVSVGGYPRAFETWSPCRIPGGFVSYLHAWGGYHLCGYLPVRTPLYSEKVVRMYAAHNVKGVGLDSPPAMMWGLEGPTVYVYARMLDSLENHTVQTLTEAYVRAAYGNAAPAMSRFFSELHHALEIYAEVFGVDNGSFQAYKRADGRSVRYLTWQDKLRLIGFLYPPETLSLLENHLAQAEKAAGLSAKHELRLALVRREFDYLNSTARVVHMYHAYQTRRDRPTLDQLLDEMEAREHTIMQWYDTDKPPHRPGIWTQEPIASDWPMYIGGAGYYNDHLMRNGGHYLSQPVPPFTWNIARMREAPIFDARKLTVRRVAAPLSRTAASWEDIPPATLGPVSLGAPAPERAGSVRIAYDATALYVRFSGELPRTWTEPPAAGHDEDGLLKAESFSAVLAPDSNPARYYRLTGGVAKTARYDARRGFIEDAIDPRFNRDDPAWNPVWNYDAGVAAKRESWSALLTIPFESLEVAPPGSGTEWKGNFGRLHQARPGAPREVSLWSANPDTTAIEDRQAFGRLVFE